MGLYLLFPDPITWLLQLQEKSCWDGKRGIDIGFTIGHQARNHHLAFGPALESVAERQG